MVVDEGEQLVCLPSVTLNAVVNGGWSLTRGVVKEGFYCTAETQDMHVDNDQCYSHLVHQYIFVNV